MFYSCGVQIKIREDVIASTCEPHSSQTPYATNLHALRVPVDRRIRRSRAIRVR